MNQQVLRRLELQFLSQYPEGFDSPEMKEISKKHNIYKLEQFAHEHLSKEQFVRGYGIIDNITKLVSKSSMVSVFEKMRFRDLVREMDDTEKMMIVDAVYQLLHEDEEGGFVQLCSILEPYKLAKWPIITVFRIYYYLQNDVLIKPTTVKNVIKTLELSDIVYQSKPSYDFYCKYRDYINEMKLLVEPSLSPNNPAFSGFLMSTM